MYSLGNHEMRLYRTCKAIHEAHQMRRSWWQHIQLANCLAWHLNPVKAKRAWESFFAWREYVYGDPLPVRVPSLRPSSGSGDAEPTTAHNAFLEDYPGPDEESMSQSSYSSCPDHPPEDSESEFSEDDDNAVLDWVTGRGPRGGPPCERCGQLPSVCYSDTFGLMCFRCPQNDKNRILMAHWGKIYRTHPVLGDVGITRHIVEFLWSDGLYRYCSCGQCNPNWFLHGWVCYDCN